MSMIFIPFNIPTIKEEMSSEKNASSLNTRSKICMIRIPIPTYRSGISDYLGQEIQPINYAKKISIELICEIISKLLYDEFEHI